MTAKADKVLQEALRLPGQERAQVAAELLASLGPAVPPKDRTDEQWIAEIERRAREARAGAPGIPWEEARRRIEDRLAGR